MSHKCPRCFHELPAHPEQLLCIGECQEEQDPAASSVMGFAVASRPRLDPSDVDPGGDPCATCTECGVETTTEACPTCHYGVPARWRRAVVTCVALAGARNSGKSLLIAAGELQLELLAEMHWQSTVDPLGTTKLRFAEEYLKPLQTERRLLDSTRELADTTTVNEPFIFRFTERRKNREGKPQSRQRVLVLRDIAGEDLQKRPDDRDLLGFYGRADAVVVVIDPLWDNRIKLLLAGIVPQEQKVGGDPLPVLRAVLNHMAGDAEARTDIPLAVVLSKFDLLQQLREVSDSGRSALMRRFGCAMSRDPSLAHAAYDRADGDRLHEEIRSLLHELQYFSVPHEVEDRANRFRFFAASALGAAPDGQFIDAGGMAPFRVLDPFKWALDTTSPEAMQV